MTMLATAAYDPAVAVTKSAGSLLAMTAFDTTNLRVTFTAPTNGAVLVRLKCQTSGGTNFPRVLLGVLDGATVRGRASPLGALQSAAAGQSVPQECAYLVTGLTPGNSYTWDAAYGVEVTNASSNLKYGGPNDATGADAWGAITFEVWKTDNLVAGTFYDPTTSVTASMTALLAMTAFDTTNLRLTFTPPASGSVYWRIAAQQHGSTTAGQPLLGILSGATVIARSAPVSANPQTIAATSCIPLLSSGVVTGLAGSQTWDAAYAVQVVAAAGGIKYGGPNNTTTNDAFGGFAFEVWSA